MKTKILALLTMLVIAITQHLNLRSTMVRFIWN